MQLEVRKVCKELLEAMSKAIENHDKTQLDVLTQAFQRIAYYQTEEGK